MATGTRSLAGVSPSSSEPVTGELSLEGCAGTSTMEVISILEESLTDRMSSLPETCRGSGGVISLH